MKKEKKDEEKKGITIEKLKPLGNIIGPDIEMKSVFLGTITPKIELKFGQTVYLVEYYPGDEEGAIVVPCSNPSDRSNRRNAVHRIRNGEYKIGEWRVVSFDDREVYLHWRGFVDRSKVIINKEHAEQKLKQLEEEKENDSSESEQLHAGGRELF